MQSLTTTAGSSHDAISRACSNNWSWSFVMIPDRARLSIKSDHEDDDEDDGADGADDADAVSAVDDMGGRSSRDILAHVFRSRLVGSWRANLGCLGYGVGRRRDQFWGAGIPTG